MKAIFELIVAFAGICAIILALPAWAACLYYLFRFSRSVKHDPAYERPRSGLDYFRFRRFPLFAEAASLSPETRLYRRRVLIAALLFIVPIAVTVLFHGLAS